VAGRGETILLAESRPYIREIVASALAAAGYRVIQVNDSAAAQQFVAGADGKVDMLVLDADGHRSGVEALAAMRESGIDAPAVLTTTQADMSLEGPAAERTLVLRKPFQVSELTRIIRGMLSHHASAPLLAPE
jgi:DNA-binding response OmpR family regulator